jgi:hypothetical protein
MTEQPAITATAAVTATATVRLPPGWTTEPIEARPDRPLYAATGPGARLTVTFRQLSDPRTLIPRQVRMAAGAHESEPPVATSYLDLPAGRAILAETAAARGAAQLWLPLSSGSGALVVSLVADRPAWSGEAAALVAEIGQRLLIDRTASVRLRGDRGDVGSRCGLGGRTVSSAAGRPVLAAR